MAGFLDQFQQQNYVSSYMALPIEEITQTAATLDKMYWDNLQNSSDLKAAIASIKTETIDGQIVKDAATRTSNYLREYADNGNYEDASLAINNAYTSLKTDKRLIAAVATKRSRDAVKDNLDKMYRAGQIDKILYDRRLREFNAYNGVDNLYDKEGDMYHDYNFEYGPNYFDTEAEISKLASNFNFDKQAHSNSRLEKSKEVVGLGRDGLPIVAGTYGINSAKTSSTKSIIEAKDFYKYFKESIYQNTAALSYYKEVVDELNINRPADQKITLEGYVEQQALHAKSKYDGVDIATAKEEIEDYQDILNLKGRLGGGGGTQTALATVPTNIPFLEHKTDQKWEASGDFSMRSAMEQSYLNAKKSGNKTATAFFRVLLGVKGATGANNAGKSSYNDLMVSYLLTASGRTLPESEEARLKFAENYMDAANNIVKNTLPVSVKANTYADITEINKRKGWIEENITAMTLYNIKTGEIISGSQFRQNNMGDKGKMKDFTFNGIPSVDSPYMLMTGNPNFAASAGVITDSEDNVYTLSGATGRETSDPNGLRYDVAYNLISQTKALGGKMNLPIPDPVLSENRAFSARYNTATDTYSIFEITGNKFKPLPILETGDVAEAAEYITTLMAKPLSK